MSKEPEGIFKPGNVLKGDLGNSPLFIVVSSRNRYDADWYFECIILVGEWGMSGAGGINHFSKTEYWQLSSLAEAAAFAEKTEHGETIRASSVPYVLMAGASRFHILNQDDTIETVCGKTVSKPNLITIEPPELRNLCCECYQSTVIRFDMGTTKWE
jgi:hypothetical protein